MRFFAYSENGHPAIGLQTKQRAIALASLAEDLPCDLCELVAQGAPVLERIAKLSSGTAGQSLDRSKLKNLAPFGTRKIICIGLNYAAHATETQLATSAYPVVFTRFSSTVIAPGEPILRPRVSVELDYEVELVAVIGRRAHYVSKQQALDYVAGYTVANDVSVRDYQFKTTQFTVGKNFDTSCPLGPDFVTADELPAGAKDLKISTRLNGQIVQSQSTSDMIFDVATLVSLLSDVMTLEPGDIILTGTPSGVGMARVPKLWMKHGDVCECEVERVGILRNQVRDEA
jgi:acylpyruvate hydrolase